MKRKPKKQIVFDLDIPNPWVLTVSFPWNHPRDFTENHSDYESVINSLNQIYLEIFGVSYTDMNKMYNNNENDKLDEIYQNRKTDIIYKIERNDIWFI